jgi:hypothetical protein
MMIIMEDTGPSPVVMAGLVPAIHVLRAAGQVVDARNKSGHDGFGSAMREAPHR